jgi:hypothetical protein
VSTVPSHPRHKLHGPQGIHDWGHRTRGRGQGAGEQGENGQGTRGYKVGVETEVSTNSKVGTAALTTTGTHCNTIASGKKNSWRGPKTVGQK